MFLHVFEFDTVTFVTVSYGKSFVCVFCWAWPRSSCCFAAFETKRKSGWGICGSSWFGLCCCMWWFAFLTGTGQLRCVLLFSLLMSLSGPCHRASTAKLEEKKSCLPRHQKHVFACFRTCFCGNTKKLLRILPTIFAGFVLAQQSHSSFIHEKLLTREFEITMAWTQNY